ncbi:MAG: DsbA family protein [Elusimicrobia bacterium]|nr:DsbA family protein [Elusimicrobiota bacterium]
MESSVNIKRTALALGILLLLWSGVAASRRLLARRIPELSLHLKTMGSSRAPVHIIEFSDFQCSHCKRAQEPLKKLWETYGEKARLTFKHYPLGNMHPNARAASLAAECAHAQGKFWAYHDLLFDTQELWAIQKDASAYFLDLADRAALNAEEFKNCLKDPKMDERVQRDIDEGDARQINSTPTFFLNEKRLVGTSQMLRNAAQMMEAYSDEQKK